MQLISIGTKTTKLRNSREEKSQKKLDDSAMDEPIVIDSSDDEEDIRMSEIRVSRKRSRNESSGEYGDLSHVDAIMLWPSTLNPKP